MGPIFTAKLLPGLGELGQGVGLRRQRQEDLKFEDSLDYTVRYTPKDKKSEPTNQPSFYCVPEFPALQLGDGGTGGHNTQ